jgi:hypothetical protein
MLFLQGAMADVTAIVHSLKLDLIQRLIGTRQSFFKGLCHGSNSEHAAGRSYNPISLRGRAGVKHLDPGNARSRVQAGDRKAGLVTAWITGRTGDNAG